MSVKLRKKNLVNGRKSLYLDIYHHEQRYYEFLKLYLMKGTDSKTKAVNNDIQILAETIRANRDVELQFADHEGDIEIKKPQELLKHFAAIGIQQLGTGQVLDMLETSRQSGKLSKMQAHRFKHAVKVITSTPELVEPNDSIKELDKKVNRAVMCYR